MGPTSGGIYAMAWAVLIMILRVNHKFIELVTTLLQMAANEKERRPLLRPPLKRKATKWLKCKNPPPLTFTESPPINNGIYKIIRKNGIIGSAIIADAKRHYKNEKCPRLPLLQIPATKSECQIRVDTLTGRRVVRVEHLQCHRLFKGGKKCTQGSFSLMTKTLKEQGRTGGS